MNSNKPNKKLKETSISIYDQHVHCNYSFDSDETIQNYLDKALALGLKYFVLTDHCDFNSVYYKRDLVFDIKKEQEELENIANKYPSIKILKGIEMGYLKSELDRINKTLSDNSFDLINLSVHENGVIDYYMTDEFLKGGLQETLKEYFELVLEALDSEVDFDVLSHFDYGFKTAYLIDNTLKMSDYDEYITKILSKLIKADKTLEVNIKVERFINDEHTLYFLRLYKKLGGKNITISTDAHEVEYFCNGINHYVSLLKEVGFDHVNYFVNRKRYDIKI